MKQKTAILAFVAFLVIATTEAQLSSKPGQCPWARGIKQCTPRCVVDSECSGSLICCPNVCGSSSCSLPQSHPFTTKGSNCPMRSTVYICNPRCVSDFQCSGNRICCPNVCGSSSCVDPSPVHTGSYRSGYDSAVYCAGVKCRAYEKCEFDRRTKREKCVRR